jgi:hypothetical protein
MKNWPFSKLALLASKSFKISITHITTSKWFTSGTIWENYINAFNDSNRWNHKK